MLSLTSTPAPLRVWQLEPGVCEETRPGRSEAVLPNFKVRQSLGEQGIGFSVLLRARVLQSRKLCGNKRGEVLPILTWWGRVQRWRIPENQYAPEFSSVKYKNVGNRSLKLKAKVSFVQSWKVLRYGAFSWFLHAWFSAGEGDFLTLCSTC